MWSRWSRVRVPSATPVSSARRRLRRSMCGDLASATRFLVLVLSVLYALAAIGGVALLDFDTTRDLVLWARVPPRRSRAAARRPARWSPPGDTVGGARLARRGPRRPPALLDAHRAGRSRRRDRLQHRARAATPLLRLMLHTRHGLVARGGRRGHTRATARGRRHGGCRHRRRRLSRPVDGVAPPRARARAGRARARGRAVRPWPERPQRRVLRDAVGRRADAARAGGRRRRARRLPRVRGRRARDRRVVRANGVDAWFREAPMLRVATTESQVGSWDDDRPRSGRARCARRGRRRCRPSEVRARCASPLFLGGAALPPERDRAPGPARARAPREAARARASGSTSEPR